LAEETVRSTNCVAATTPVFHIVEFYHHIKKPYLSDSLMGCWKFVVFAVFLPIVYRLTAVLKGDALNLLKYRNTA